MTVAAGQVTASTLLVLPLVLIVDRPWALAMPGWTTWGALLGLSLLCTAFAYTLYFRILATAGATNLMLVTLLVPVSAILLGALFLAERLELKHFAGMALIAMAIVWWITFNTKVGGIGGAFECLFITTGPCADTIARSELEGYFAYRPFLMWIGVALWLAGVVLNPRRIEIAPLAWAAVGIPLLWAVWITIEKALVLFT